MSSKLDAGNILRKAFSEQSGGLKMENASSLVPESFDEIVLSYTGSDLTGVVYKKDTVTVATLTLSYSGGNLTSVVRS